VLLSLPWLFHKLFNVHTTTQPKQILLL